MATPPEAAPAVGRDRLELFSTLLLAMAAVATAWSSYQATRWNGEQAVAASRTNAIRIEAARQDSLADAETQVDIATFVQWVDANNQGDTGLADFYRQRFRPEFRPAFDAWIATDPFTDATAPPTPFAMPDYRVEAKEEAAQLDSDAEDAASVVRRDIQRASNYVLGVVMFAVALFFAGISTKLTSRRLRVVMLVMGCTVFAVTLAWVATFPVSFAT